MTTDIGTILHALDFAATMHCHHRRKGADRLPYINHPIAVARLIREIAGVEDVVTLAAAVLHDVVEDTQATEDQLRQLFGDAITAVVMEVTDDKSLPKATRKALQIEHGPHLSERARLVKLADKIHNLEDMLRSEPVGWSLDRMREYFDWAHAVVGNLRGTSPPLEARFDELYSRRP